MAKKDQIPTLILKSTPYALQNSVLDLGRAVNNVPILSTSFSYNPWVTFVNVYVRSNVFPKTLEYACAAREMKRSKIGVFDCGLNELRSTWYELDDTGRNTGLCQNIVHKIIRVGCSRSWLPYYNIADECRY